MTPNISNSLNGSVDAVAVKSLFTVFFKKKPFSSGYG
jgi:hypothetical protein